MRVIKDFTYTIPWIKSIKTEDLQAELSNRKRGSGIIIELIPSNLRRYTFESPKIKEWVEFNSYGEVLNLFAGKTKLQLKELRNDVDSSMTADFYMDALNFILYWKNRGAYKFDTVILDPPYSYRKSMEMYNGNLNSRFKLIADELSAIIKKSSVIISFGYHSSFMGEVRGYKLEKLCVFAHGGAQPCTIGIIEKKI